jgi:hypothetical protein
MQQNTTYTNWSVSSASYYHNARRSITQWQQPECLD